MTTQEVITALNCFGNIQEQLFNGEIHEPRLLDKSPEALSFRAAESAFLKAQAILDSWKKVEQLEDGAAIFQADDGQMVRYTVQRLFGEHAACVSIERLALVKPAPAPDHLTTLVAAAIAAYPGEQARIERGAEIVRKCGVRLTDGEAPKVGQAYHLYPIVDGRCPCPDSALGNAPEGRCKHRWALCLHKRLHATPTTSLPAGPAFRVKYFWASIGHTNGQAKICESGQCWFRAGEAGEWTPCSWEDIGLGGSINAEQVA